MSEAMQREPNPQPTERVVIPFDRNPDKLDFSEVGPEIAISYFFMEMRHPAYASKRGEELAAFIIESTRVETNEEAASHRARLIELMQQPIAFNDTELYEEKVAHDEIFRLLSQILQDTRDDQSLLKEQRRAARILMELRASFPEFKTARDEEWENVIERLFS